MMTQNWHRRIDGLALGALVALGLIAAATIIAPPADADTSRLWGATHQAANPVRTENQTVSITADLAGRLRVQGTQAEDAAHTSADVGVFAQGVRSNAATALAGTDLDYNPLQLNSVGALRTQADGIALSTSEVLATAADVALVAATAGLRLQYVSLRETAGAAASFAIRHGAAATDIAICYISLAANESKTVEFGEAGVVAASGLFADRITGTADITYGTKTRSP